MSYASRWNFWIDIQFQRVSWSSASNSAPPSPAVTAAVSRWYASAGVFAFWRQPAPDADSATIARPSMTAGARRHASAHSGNAGLEQVVVLGSAAPRRHDRSGPEQPPAGAVDEFAHIPRRRSRHPLITLAGALLAFFLVFYGWRDLRYALSSGEPLELGYAAAGVQQRQGDARASRTATSASRARPTARARSSWTPRGRGCSASCSACWAPATGCSSTAWRTRCPPARAEADVFEGRLIRIDELPYADAIRGYFAKHVTATHYFAADAALKALAGARAGRAAVDRRSGRRQGVARRRRGAGGRGRPARRGPDRPAALPLPDRGRGPRGDHVARRRGVAGEGPGARRRRRPARARGTCWPPRPSRPRAGRSSCVSPPRAGRPRSTSWATSIAPSRSATRARPSRPTRTSWPPTTARWSSAPPGAPGAPPGRRRHRRRAHDGPRRDPGGRLLAGRRRSPARAHQQHPHRAGAGGVRRVQYRRARPQPMTLRIHDTRTGKKVPFEPLVPGKVEPLRLRHDGLRPLPHRPRAQGGRVGRHHAPPARQRVRAALRPQHHRRRRQDHQQGEGRGDHRPTRWRASTPHEMNVDFAALGLAAPDLEPRATEHIAEVIEIIRPARGEGPGLRGRRRRLLRGAEVRRLRRSCPARASTI